MALTGQLLVFFSVSRIQWCQAVSVDSPRAIWYQSGRNLIHILPSIGPWFSQCSQGENPFTAGLSYATARSRVDPMTRNVCVCAFHRVNMKMCKYEGKIIILIYKRIVFQSKICLCASSSQMTYSISTTVAYCDLALWLVERYSNYYYLLITPLQTQEMWYNHCCKYSRSWYIYCDSDIGVLIYFQYFTV